MFSVFIDLPVPRPYDAPGVFRFLAIRAIEGVETAELTTPGRLRYARTLRLPGGPAEVEVTAIAGRDRGDVERGWALRARLVLVAEGDMAPATDALRRMFDLDTDPTAIDSALHADPVLAPLVERTPGIRVPGASDPHELLVRAVVGQQISVARARAHLGRLTARAGSSYEGTIPGLTRLFPTPEQILDHVPEPVRPLDPDRPLRLPARSVRTVRALAAIRASGDLEIPPDTRSGALQARLTTLSGIGPWTGAYVAMRLLPDPDAWLIGDVAVVAGARTLGLIDEAASKPATHQALAARAKVWAPWRSYATMHFWHAASEASHRR